MIQSTIHFRADTKGSPALTLQNKVLVKSFLTLNSAKNTQSSASDSVFYSPNHMALCFVKPALSVYYLDMGKAVSWSTGYFSSNGGASGWQPSVRRGQAGATTAHTFSNKGENTLSREKYHLLYKCAPQFTLIKSFSIEDVWLPKLLNRSALNWQGNSSHWSFQPTDKGELIKNKNLIKPILNQQQLWSVHKSPQRQNSFHIFYKAVTWDPLKNSRTEKAAKTRPTLMSRRVIYSAHIALLLLYNRVKILRDIPY